MKNIVSLLILITGIISCKPLSIQKKEITQVILASIGKQNNSLTKTSFQINAIPILSKKVRVGVFTHSFTKSIFTTYKNIDKNTQLKYIDSIPNKPKYLTLSVLDKVTLINNLNNKQNTDIFSYLKTAANAKIITEISFVLPNTEQQSLQQADEIYLIQKNYKAFALEVIKQNNKKIINFADAKVFDYKATPICWGSYKHHIEIVDIGNKCPSSTYKTFRKAKKKNSKIKLINY